MGRRISLLRGILISAIVILSFILFSAYASFQNANRAEFASQWANHTYDVLWHLDHFYSALQAASSHQRGYLLTGRKILLIRYQRSAANTQKRLEEIAPLISDNPRQQSNWIKLKEDTEDRLKEANRTLQIAQKHALKKELRTQAIKQGSHSMSQIRHLIAQMEEEEKRLLQDRLGSEERRAKKLMTSILIETFLAILFLALSTWVILNQIRQRERLQKEKAQLNADTVSMMTHELKNPLTVIYSSLAALTDERKNGYLNENRHILDIALKSSRRMRRLIEDFLEIQKLEYGAIEFRISEIRLSSLIKESLEAAQTYAAQKKIKLSFKDNFPEASINVDSERFLQVMANLLSNAIKHSPNDSEIEIKTSREGNRIKIAVTDHGPGIPAYFKNRLFQKFSRDTHESEPGTGLGLSISKIIVEKMGGVIGFDPSNSNGATFYFELPEASH